MHPLLRKWWALGDRPPQAMRSQAPPPGHRGRPPLPAAAASHPLRRCNETHVPGGGEAGWQTDAKEKTETTKRCEKTIEMIDFSDNIWMHERRMAKDKAMVGRVQELLASEGSSHRVMTPLCSNKCG
eukprot:6457432-Amphidinium_carterae.1